ncbi:Retrovirus-related Pol polyprotein from transposon, partial [Dictyocoela roeselum]
MSFRRINNFSKSVLVNFYNNLHLLNSQHILSSKENLTCLKNEIKKEEMENRKIAYIDNSIDTAAFEFKNETSGLKIIHKLNLLQSIDDQDLINWRLCFLEVSRICGWSSSTQQEVLNQIVDINIQYQIGPTLSPEETLHKICKLKYNKNTAYHYQNKLLSMKQDDYYTIQGYLINIERNCRKLAICLDWNENMLHEKIEEIFICGLDENIRFDIAKYVNQDFKSILDVLRTLEAQLVEKISKIETIQHNGYQTCSEDRPKKSIPNASFSKDKIYDKSKKYCTFHKSNSHSNHECRARKNRYKHTNSHDNQANHLIKELKTPAKCIEIPAIINENEFNEIIDTGADNNYISRSIVNQLQLKSRKKQNKQSVELADGNIIHISEEIELRFNLLGDTNNYYITNFNILEKQTNSMILGMCFLNENEAVINLSNGTLKLDGTEYEIRSDNRNTNFADKEMMDKTKVLKIEESQKKLEMIISTAKKNNPAIGKITTFKHVIKLIKPFNKILPEYPVPLGIRNEVKEHLKELERNQIIRKQMTRYISPAFAIKKKNNKIRLVIDYRYLNSITAKTHQYTLSISDILASLHSSRVFSQIDLNQGYYQIPVDENDIPKTGFKIMNEVYVFLRMPFGLCNAPSTFQYTMNNILKSIPNVFIYIDDILIYSKTLAEHVETLKSVFDCIHQNGASINFDKSTFASHSVKFLGHEISGEGIKPEITKLENINIDQIDTRKKLERFLGFVNWFRPYVRNLSTKTASLYDKLKKEPKRIILTEIDRKTMKGIIEEIQQRPLLGYPNLNVPFTLKCDASDRGIGSVLEQNGRVIGYFSKKYTKCEENYTVIEKEVLSILRSVQHFRQIIFNTKIIIMTDNANIIFQGDITKRINRWKLILEEYDYELLHIKGELNKKADYLSRSLNIRNNPENKTFLIDIREPKANTITNYTKKELSILIDKMNNQEKFNFFKTLHSELGHPGIHKFKITIRNYVNTKPISKIIKNIWLNCEVYNR